MSADQFDLFVGKRAYILSEDRDGANEFVVLDHRNDACLSSRALNRDFGLRAADCEDAVGRHMVGEALLAANFVALAEKTGMTRDAINAILKSIAERSAIQEFWITDPAGHAYLTNTGVDFTFSPDAAKQP